MSIKIVKRPIFTILATTLILGLTGIALAGGLPKPKSKNPEAQKLIDQAWDLDRSKFGAEVYKQCITLMEEADKLDPENVAILVDISRYYWNWGDSLPKQTKEQQNFNVAIYQKGLAAAEKSLKVEETVPGHGWYAANKAASVEFSSIPIQAKTFPSLMSHLDYVSEHDEGYWYYALGRIWAEIVARVPRKVIEILHMQQSVKDVDEILIGGVKDEPRFLDNYYYRARLYYIYYEDDKLALELLDHVLKQDPKIFPEEVTANRASQAKAYAFWKEITGKPYPRK